MVNKEIRLEIKDIFNQIYDLCINGEFKSVANILMSLNINNIDIKILIAYLSVTNIWKECEELKYTRNLFLSLVEQKMIKEIGEIRTINILKGLRNNK